jgi:hypothetical protein
MKARTKGSVGELEACRWLERKVFGNIGLTRNLEQTRSGGADIIQPPFAFEIKRRKRSDRQLNYDGWWIQVNKATDKLSRESYSVYYPVVMFRIDNGDWEFLIPATQIGCKQGWIHISRTRFVEWVKSFARIGQEPFTAEDNTL